MDLKPDGWKDTYIWFLHYKIKDNNKKVIELGGVRDQKKGAKRPTELYFMHICEISTLVVNL